MKSIVKRVAMGLSIALMLTGCGSFDGKRDGIPLARPVPLPSTIVRDGAPILGAPFTIDGTTYKPVDVADYDAVGYASWYGDEFAGKSTANGEIYNPDSISAAHKTLPMPSYVEVTALDSGRTILVRVNDRGPMTNGRLIDLSKSAAMQLGITGVAPVRVRRTNPSESERAQLRAGRIVAARLPTPDSLLAILRKNVADLPVPPPRAEAVTPSAPPGHSDTTTAATPKGERFIVEGSGPKAAPPSSKGSTAVKPAVTKPYIVQVAAFSTKSRAETLAGIIGGHVSEAGKYWRVRVGPFATESEAKAAHKTIQSKGFGDARVMRDR